MEFEKKRIINYLDMKKEMEILEDIKGLWESEERKIIQEAGKYEVEKKKSVSLVRCEETRQQQVEQK